jgi:hypothetical protein
MSDDRTFERNARAWLELGPTDIPARVIADALRTIESTPQERHLWMPWKDLRMSPSMRLATAAAIGVLAIGGGLLVFGNQSPQFGHPTPVPSGAPSQAVLASGTPNPASLVTDLQSKWVSDTARPDPYAASVYVHDLVIDATNVVMNEFKGPVTSAWSLVGPGIIGLSLSDSQPYLLGHHWDVCHSSDVGTYSISLSSDSKTLTLGLVADPCGPRSGILAGGWSRWPCPNPASVCQPQLAPGQHTTAFARYVDPNSVSSPPPTALSSYSYTVPAGWSDVGNAVGGNASLGRPNDPYTMAITLTLDVAPHSQAADCRDVPESGVGLSPTAMADWLASLPALVATAPQPITIGGYNGQMVDVSIDPSWTLGCFGDAPSRLDWTFTDPVPDPNGYGFLRIGLDGDTHSRYILLDLGNGHNLLINVSAPDQASWSELVQASMPIINTFTFTPGTP